MSENNQEKEIKDTKAIEEKALNYLKSFIEDSKVISQFIDDNDKEPCWEFKSVGTRFFEDYQDGLCEFILKWLELTDLTRKFTEEA